MRIRNFECVAKKKNETPLHPVPGGMHYLDGLTERTWWQILPNTDCHEKDIQKTTKDKNDHDAQGPRKDCRDILLPIENKGEVLLVDPAQVHSCLITCDQDDKEQTHCLSRLRRDVSVCSSNQGQIRELVRVRE